MSTITLPPIRRPLPPPLGLRTVAPWLFFLACVIASVGGLSGAYDPSPWSQFHTEWGSPWIVSLVYSLVVILVGMALFWVMKVRAIDMVCLWLAREALGLVGYFYLDKTAAYQPQSETGILGLSGLMVMIAAVGFLSFLFGAILTRKLTAAFRFPLRGLPAPAADLDRRLVVLLRFLALYCVFAAVLPMALSGSIPLLSEAGSQSARTAFSHTSDGARALYNLEASLLPFVVGGLVVSIVRRPLRVLGWDGICILLVCVAQFLTSNRAPLLFALGVSICLPTLLWRWPRWLLAFALSAYLFVVVFLGGFTSLLRTHPRSLLEPDWFAQSIQAAYLGDNIIDLRDGAWVFANWDFRPMEGMTYLGGLFAPLPSGLFPEKKQWHLGMVAVRMVGLPEDQHGGLRVTTFGESFLNFGWPGTLFVGLTFGALIGVLRRQLELAGPERRSLWWGMRMLIAMQCVSTLTDSGDAYSMWALLGFLGLVWIFVTYPAKRKAETAAGGGGKKKSQAPPLRMTRQVRPRVTPPPPAQG